jgi:hypothetical protein
MMHTVSSGSPCRACCVRAIGLEWCSMALVMGCIFVYVYMPCSDVINEYAYSINTVFWQAMCVGIIWALLGELFQMFFTLVITDRSVPVCQYITYMEVGGGNVNIPL